MGSIVDENIEPFFEFTQLQFLFHRDQRGSILQFLLQVTDEILTHPFFRGQHDPFAPDLIEYEITAVLRFDAERRWRIIDFDHQSE